MTNSKLRAWVDAWPPVQTTGGWFFFLNRSPWPPVLWLIPAAALKAEAWKDTGSSPPNQRSQHCPACSLRSPPTT